MFVDNGTEQGEMVGKFYELTEDIKALCCGTILKKNGVVEVLRYTSKNRLLIVMRKSDHNVIGAAHKIKRSNLNRMGKEIINERS